MSQSFKARLLVVAQFTIIGYFILFHPIIQPLTVQDILATLLILSGILLGGSALYTMRRSRFRIMPEPHQNATLLTDGPYRFIRHPMYSALLLVAFGLFLNYPILSHLVAFALLFGILGSKIHIEEAFLREKFPGYEAYASKSKRLIPFIF